MEKKDVPYIVYEAEATRRERTIKRLIITIALCVALLFASNMAWLYFFSQFDIETVTTEQTTEGGGNANYIGMDGSIINNGRTKGKTD